MIIVWRGLGLPILMAGGAAFGIVAALFGLEYLSHHNWPLLIACGAGGAVVYFLGSVRENKSGIRDSVYGIPVKAWAVLYLAIGVCCSFLPPLGAQINARGFDAGGIPQPTTTRSATVNGLRLQAIFYGVPGRGSAIINNQTVFAGDRIGDLTVKAVEPQLVTLQAANGRATVLRLSDAGR